MAVPSPTHFAGQFLGWLTHRVTPPTSTVASVTAPLAEATDQGLDEQTKLVRKFLSGGRVALLLRPAISRTMTAEQTELAKQCLRREAVAITGGPVVLSGWVAEDPEEDFDYCRVLEVGDFWCDRHPVTNRQFAEFVAQGGYRQEALWDPAIWPRVSEFRDRTQQLAPRGWTEATFSPGTDTLPVVGVSWYEADAYARWSGKRLPSDAEWVKVAACPLAQGDTVVERRFPWGDHWNPDACHLAVVAGGPTSVDTHAAGATSNGVSHLLGNVWEWTSNDFSAVLDGQPLRFPSSFKSLRGGAFDSQFPQQASCQLQSGEAALARRPNIGFRCVISADQMIEGL